MITFLKLFTILLNPTKMATLLLLRRNLKIKKL